MARSKRSQRPASVISSSDSDVQTRREDFAQQILAANVTLANPAVSAMLGGSHDRAQTIAVLAGIVDVNATVVSYDYIFRFCAIAFVLSVPTVLLLKKPPNAAAAKTTHAVLERRCVCRERSSDARGFPAHSREVP